MNSFVEIQDCVSHAVNRIVLKSLTLSFYHWRVISEAVSIIYLAVTERANPCPGGTVRV